MTGSAAAQPSSATPRAVIGADEHYINYAEPEVQPDTAGREVKGKDGIYTPAVSPRARSTRSTPGATR